jgi:hypothetical protein
MIEAEVSLYLVTRVRLARLQKTIAFRVLPRLREFVKVRNREQGDYFAFSVVQVTHREGGSPELWLHLTNFAGGRSVVSFLEDGELDEYLDGYKQEGWTVASVVPNRTFRDDGSSVWSEMGGADEAEAEPGAAPDPAGGWHAQNRM